MQGELQAFKVGRIVRNRTFIYKGLTVTLCFRHSNLKACSSLYMQYYFKRFFVVRSSEVIFSFLIKKSRQKAIEIEIYFTHWTISPVLHDSAESAETDDPTSSAK